ncbi:MAG: type II toxin-antitoxin system VapC family toxin [Pseudomonadota bacterium]
MSVAVHADCFDTSALVKIFTDEDGSDIVQKYFYKSTTKYTTPFCYYEALSVLKVKWLYRKLISHEEYKDAACKLTYWFSDSIQYIHDIDLTNIETFNKVIEISTNNNLDISDAFQILSVKEGYFSRLINDSKTILITADKDLSTAARNEGLKAWYFLKEQQPL